MALDKELREAADKVNEVESFWLRNKNLVIIVAAVSFAAGLLLGALLL